MSTPGVTLRADDGVIERHRAEYLAQLVAPLDDMWAAFADGASGHALRAGDVEVGSCCVDEERQLLRFHLRPAWQHRSEELLRLVLEELEVESLLVATLDPGFLGPALDVAARIELHTLLYAPTVAPEAQVLDGLVVARVEDHARVVAFEEATLGAPRAFLEGYLRARIEREELLLHVEGSEILAAGELRRDRQQAGIAQLGVVVAAPARGRGLGARLLATLVARSRTEGLTPICSTEVGNHAARRAIERAGFRPAHRLVRVSFERSTPAP